MPPGFRLCPEGSPMAVTQPTPSRFGDKMAAMRYPAVLALVLAVACSKSESKPSEPEASKQPAASDAAPAVDPGLPEHAILPSAKEAFALILEQTPRVLGIGEYHQTLDTAHIESALATFEAELLGSLDGYASDLVIETFIPTGACGAAEKVVTETVRKETKRPETVEDELTRLIKHTRKLGIDPHILTMTCQDFEGMLVDGEVDFVEKLLWVTRELARVTNSIVTYRDELDKTRKDYDPDRSLVVVYSGAHHNAVVPQEGLADFSYVSRLVEAVDDYIEVDLYVPEFVEGKKTAQAEAWYPLLKKADKDHVLLYERSPQSYVILLQRDRVASKARK